MKLEDCETSMLIIRTFCLVVAGRHWIWILTWVELHNVVIDQELQMLVYSVYDLLSGAFTC